MMLSNVPQMTVCGACQWRSREGAKMRRCRLGVWSRHLLERADIESLWFCGPGFADELVWGEASEGFEASGEVVGVDEVLQVRPELVVGLEK